MKNLLILGAISLLTTSCVSLNGNLLVTEKITLKKKGGFLNLKRINVDVEANEYKAELSAKGENSFTLTLKNGVNEIKVPIKSDKNLNVPKFDGEFFIASSDIAQPYDIKGVIQTDISYSATEQSIESCTYTVHVRDCNDVRDHGRDGKRDIIRDREGNIQCQDRVITRTGRHEVIYHYKTTDRDLKFEFLKAGTIQSVAQFAGRDYDVDKVIEREGVCN